MSRNDDAAVSREPDVDAPASRDWCAEEERALRVWIALARCYFTFARSVTARIAEYDLTTPQFGVLEALLHLGPLSLGELADKLLVTGGNVTFVMDRLEKQGLVLRERSGEDRRIVQAKLTPKGRRVVSEAFPQHASFIRELASELEPEEQEKLRELLKKLGRGLAGTSAPEIAEASAG